MDIGGVFSKSIIGVQDGFTVEYDFRIGIDPLECQLLERVLQNIIIDAEVGRITNVALRHPFHSRVVVTKQRVLYHSLLLQIQVNVGRDACWVCFAFQRLGLRGTSCDCDEPIGVELCFRILGCVSEGCDGKEGYNESFHD